MNPSPVLAVRLSCEQCKQRKTKCDKQVPCTACKNAGIRCATVQRARRPRGRTVQRKGGEIDTRIARLEDLVKQLKAQVQSSKEHNAAQEDAHLLEPEGYLAKYSNALQSYVASDFWEALSQEANGIREILEEFDNKDASSQNSFASPGPKKEPFSNSGILLFNQGTSGTEFDTSQHLTKQMTSRLLSTYHHRVDPILKVLHWPSAIAAVEKKNIEARSDGQWTRIHALESAIHFMALCTMTDAECEQQLYCKKGPIMQQLRIAAESSISKAKLLEYPDLTVLHAYVIYLTGLRCSTTGATSWTLLSIAVRLANALKLGSEDTTRYSPYDLEIRRRLWFSIGMLDTQLALDRGSLPLLYCKDFESSPPSTLNDTDLFPTCTQLPSSQSFTNMSFSSMTHRAMMCQKKLYETDINPLDPWGSWNEKIAAISVFEDYVLSHFSGINTSSTPLEQFTRAVVEGSLVNIKLMLRRPPYRNRHCTVPPWDDFDVMGATTEILERSLNKQANAEFAPWAWFAWVKWYALAVLLAELCGSSPATDHSYLVARETFAQYAPVVADSESGMLWKPIVKLMSRVQRLRGSTTIAKPNGTIYGNVDTENDQQTRMEDVFGSSLPWINWDSFLEDMTNSTHMDWGMYWGYNS